MKYNTISSGVEGKWPPHFRKVLISDLRTLIQLVFHWCFPYRYRFSLVSLGTRKSQLGLG